MSGGGVSQVRSAPAFSRRRRGRSRETACVGLRMPRRMRWTRRSRSECCWNRDRRPDGRDHRRGSGRATRHPLRFLVGYSMRAVDRAHEAGGRRGDRSENRWPRQLQPRTQGAVVEAREARELLTDPRLRAAGGIRGDAPLRDGCISRLYRCQLPPLLRFRRRIRSPVGSRALPGLRHRPRHLSEDRSAPRGDRRIVRRGCGLLRAADGGARRGRAVGTPPPASFPAALPVPESARMWQGPPPCSRQPRRSSGPTSRSRSSAAADPPCPGCGIRTPTLPAAA